MKTAKILTSILLVATISGTSFAQSGLLDKAKDAAKKAKKDKAAKETAKKTDAKGKGGDEKMAVKGSGVSQNTTTTTTTTAK